MRYASVCDGIGAAHVAWQPLGWQCSWTSEIEPFPAAVVEHHFGFANMGDMTTITEEMLDAHGPVDLLVGGTPCQSFSVAGLRGGLDDPRGNLALRFVQLASFLKPKWIVWENVPGVLSSGKGRDFGTFLGALGELGYGFAYRVLDAQWFGVAQRRRRVFVVGHLGDWRRAAAVLFERESVFGNPPTRGKAGERVARSTEASLTSSGRGVERCGESRGQDDVVLGRPIWRGGDQANSEHCIDHAGTLNCDKGQQGGIVGIPDPAYAIAAGNQGKGGVFGSGRDSQDTFAVVAFHPTQDPISSVDGSTHAMGCGSKGGCCTQAVAFQSNLGSHGGDVFEDGTSPTVRVGSGLGIPSPPAVAFKPSHFTRGKDGAPADVVSPLSADADKGDQDTVLAVPFTKSKRAQSTTDDETWVPGEVSPTMSCFDQGDGRKVEVGVRQAMAVRRLTPRECERLQGFPAVCEKVIVTVCIDHQSAAVLVGLSCLRWQVNASPADAERYPRNADTAAGHSGTIQADRVPLAAISVRTASVDELLEIRSRGRLIWSANNAGESSAFRLPTQSGAIAADLASLLRCLALAIRTGKEESLQNIRFSFQASSGAKNALACGSGSAESASVVRGDARAEKFTTSALGELVPICDSPIATWLCSALNVISGCIPSKTLPEHFSLEFDIETPYTLVEYRKKPAADGPRYRALGNSMAVPVMRWIGERIAMVEGMR